MSKILFYLIIKPISLLPLGITYKVSNFLFYLNWYVIAYRKKVVLSNLRKAFPNKSEAEIIRIAKLFFRHFCDLIVESVRVFSISEKELRRRCQLKNPEVLEDYHRRGKSVLVIAAHYNNWELAAIACDLQVPHQTIGIYKPLKDPFINRKLQESRVRFGLELLPRKLVKRGFEKNKDILTATLFGGDQAPPPGTKAYWTTFLGIETPVMFGTERLAKEYDFPVVFGRVSKVKRGHYQFEFESLEDNPRDTAIGKITEQHTRVLEKEILKNPQYWLWTHKRWKRKKEDFLV